MTHRTEKPSQHESSTDTLISALETIAKVLDQPQGGGLYTTALLEAAQRLDKLESQIERNIQASQHAARTINQLSDELDQLRQTKTLRDEFAMAFIRGDSEWVDYEKMARTAYCVADLMMEARK